VASLIFEAGRPRPGGPMTSFPYGPVVPSTGWFPPSSLLPKITCSASAQISQFGTQRRGSLAGDELTPKMVPSLRHGDPLAIG